MKETYYFQHDYNARQDPKMQEMMVEHGISAVGVYWCVVEMLYEQGGKLSLRTFKCIAYALHVDVSLVASVVNDFGLFQNDGECFWSDSANRRLQKRADVSEARRKAIEARWGKKDTNVLEKNIDDDTNVLQKNTKERKEKEKERKEKEINNTNPIIESGANLENNPCSAVAEPRTLEGRKLNFERSLIPFLEDYGKDMLREFADYWTEPDRAKKPKMRFEKEKTWSTPHRLSTWARREREYPRRPQTSRFQASQDSMQAFIDSLPKD